MVMLSALVPLELSTRSDNLYTMLDLYLEKQQDNITRGHSLKLVNNRYHYDLRKFSFVPRILLMFGTAYQK